MSEKKSRLECDEDEERFKGRPGKPVRHEPVEKPE
jgi:hypothetical protein